MRHCCAFAFLRQGVLLLLAGAAVRMLPAAAAYPWLATVDPAQALERRIPPPPGGQRVYVEPGGFAEWLRRLPLKPGHPSVHLFDGRLKERQDVQAAVVDIDVGRRDLQQCADALVRLRAEYLWQRGEFARIRFDFLNGFTAFYPRWREGYRPHAAADGKTLEVRGSAADLSYTGFRAYLDTVFTYANSTSLRREMMTVPDPRLLAGGDAFVCSRPGGEVCHAVIVLDVCENESGRRWFLLAQSFMPAQEIHVLRNPGSVLPWYAVDFGERLVTPEWIFASQDLRRFR